MCCRPVRFKEDDKNEELMQRRMAEESVRRMQEEENRIKQRLHQASQRPRFQGWAVARRWR